MLTREEYEARRRRIDEEHASAIALLEAGRQMQIRALDLVWIASGAGGPPLLPQIEDLSLGGLGRLLPAVPGAESGVPSLPEAPSEPPPVRRRAWAVIDEIAEIFDKLPEVFDHQDLNRALGRELDRGVARRNLQMLIEDGVLASVESERGRFRLRYRKLADRIADAAD